MTHNRAWHSSPFGLATGAAIETFAPMAQLLAPHRMANQSAGMQALPSLQNRVP